MRKYIIVFIVVILVVNIISYAQQEETATPAPTKTATPDINNTIISTPEPLPTDDKPITSDEIIVPFVQEDLSILVGNVQRPNGIIWHDDTLYTSCNGDWTLYAIDDTTGSTITFVFGIRNSHMLSVESTSQGFNLWVPDFDTNTLYRVDQNRSAPAVVTTRLNGPWGIIPIEESFFITNLRANNIVLVSRDGTSQEVVNGLASPTGIASDGENVFVGNTGSARRSIEWFAIDELTEGESVETQSLIRGLQNVTDLVYMEDGYLYFTYSLGTRGIVGRVQPQSCQEEGCTNEDIEIVIFSEVPAPLSGLTITPDNRLFFHSIYRPELYWVQLPT